MSTMANAVVLKKHRYVRTDGGITELKVGQRVLLQPESPSTLYDTVIPVDDAGEPDHAAVVQMPRSLSKKVVEMSAPDASGPPPDLSGPGAIGSMVSPEAQDQPESEHESGGTGSPDGDAVSEGNSDASSDTGESSAGGPPPDPDEPAERLMTRLGKTGAFTQRTEQVTSKIVEKITDEMTKRMNARLKAAALPGGDTPLNDKQKNTTEHVAKTLQDAYQKSLEVGRAAEAVGSEMDAAKRKAEAASEEVAAVIAAASDEITKAFMKEAGIDRRSALSKTKRENALAGLASAVAADARVAAVKESVRLYDENTPDFIESIVNLIVTCGIRTICLTGPAGCGKSTAVPKIHAKLQEMGTFGPDLAYEAVQCYRNAPEQLFTGVNQYNLTDGTVTLKPSRFALALPKPSVLLTDEVDNADRSGIMVLNNAANAGGYLVQEDGTMVHRHEHNIIVFTANTMGDGATATYSGRTDLDGAFRNRIELWVPVSYNLRVEYDAVTAGWDGTDTIDLTRRLMTLYMLWQARSTSEKNDLGRIVGTRNILTAGKLLRDAALSPLDITLMVLADWPEEELALVKA